MLLRVATLAATALIYESGTVLNTFLLIGTFILSAVGMVATLQVFLGPLVLTRGCLDIGRCSVYFVGNEVVLSIAIFIESISSRRLVQHLFSVFGIFFDESIVF
jgi:hypothetical protein